MGGAVIAKITSPYDLPASRKSFLPSIRGSQVTADTEMVEPLSLKKKEEKKKSGPQQLPRENLIGNLRDQLTEA